MEGSQCPVAGLSWGLRDLAPSPSFCHQRSRAPPWGDAGSRAAASQPTFSHPISASLRVPPQGYSWESRNLANITNNSLMLRLFTDSFWHILFFFFVVVNSLNCFAKIAPNLPYTFSNPETVSHKLRPQKNGQTCRQLDLPRLRRRQHHKLPLIITLLLHPVLL